MKWDSASGAPFKLRFGPYPPGVWIQSITLMPFNVASSVYVDIELGGERESDVEGGSIFGGVGGVGAIDGTSQLQVYSSLAPNLQPIVIPVGAAGGMLTLTLRHDGAGSWNGSAFVQLVPMSSSGGPPPDQVKTLRKQLKKARKKANEGEVLRLRQSPTDPQGYRIIGGQAKN